MSIKFFPTYKLTINTDEGDISLPLAGQDEGAGFACTFTIRRTTDGTPNTAKIMVYNLNHQHRNMINQPFYNAMNALKRVSLSVGYQNNNRVFFSGSINKAGSFREGCDVTTEIDAYEGSDIFNLCNSFINVPAGTPFSEIVEMLCIDIRRFEVDNGNEDFETLLRPFDDDRITAKDTTIQGNSFELLKKYLPDNVQVFFSENGVTVLPVDGIINQDFIPKISAKTGMLGTPKYYGNSTVEVSTMFEPLMKLGSEVDIETTISSKLNGRYKLIGIEHQCTLGFGTSSSCVTNLTMILPEAIIGSGAYEI